VLISALLIGMLPVPVPVIRSTSGDCPSLSPDQAVSSAAVRYAACSTSTDAWSRRLLAVPGPAGRAARHTT
jgi:hypothetical protein